MGGDRVDVRKLEERQKRNSRSCKKRSYVIISTHHAPTGWQNRRQSKSMELLPRPPVESQPSEVARLGLER